MYSTRAGSDQVGQVHVVLDDGLVKIAVGKPVQRERNQAGLAQPVGEGLDLLLAAHGCGAAGGQPEAEAHRLVRAHQPLHRHRVFRQLLPGRRQVGAGMDVGAVTGDPLHAGSAGVGRPFVFRNNAWDVRVRRTEFNFGRVALFEPVDRSPAKIEFCTPDPDLVVYP